VTRSADTRCGSQAARELERSAYDGPMNLSSSRLAGLLAGAAAILPAVAIAADAPDGTVRAVPNKAGAGTTLKLDAHGETAALKPGETPSKVVLAFTRGYRFDGRAVAKRCTDDQAKANKCPEKSRSGRGTVQYHINGTTQEHTTTIGEFLAPRSPGAIGDVQFVVRDNDFNMTLSSHGRLVRVASGPYGAELRLDYPAPKLPPGIQLTIDRLTLQTGAHRRVTVRVGPHRVRRHRTYQLVRNPAKCPASHRWPVELRASYSSGDVTRTADIICRSK
jgi:hypothetical protein